MRNYPRERPQIPKKFNHSVRFSPPLLSGNGDDSRHRRFYSCTNRDTDEISSRYGGQMARNSNPVRNMQMDGRTRRSGCPRCSKLPMEISFRVYLLNEQIRTGLLDLKFETFARDKLVGWWNLLYRSTQISLDYYRESANTIDYVCEWKLAKNYSRGTSTCPEYVYIIRMRFF